MLSFFRKKNSESDVVTAVRSVVADVIGDGHSPKKCNSEVVYVYISGNP